MSALDRSASLVGALRRAGAFDPLGAAATAGAVTRWGATAAVPYAAAARRHGGRLAVIDDDGSLTYAELDRMTTALAASMLDAGLQPGDHLGVLARNGRRFLLALVGASKAGIVPVLLNTEFAAEQLAGVLDRESVRGVVHDPALVDIVASSGFDGVVIDASRPGTASDGLPAPPRGRLRRPVVPILLTSGTTGTPKGARRTSLGDPRPAIGLLERIPVRSADTFVIACPLFHAWGFAQALTAATIAGTTVLTERFAVDATLDAVERHRAEVLVVVPTMVQRLLRDERLERRDLSSLRVVAASGSALPVPVAVEWFERVGANLYNLYGSTEVGQATLATPDDMRAAPGTVGRPIAGTRIEILDGDDRSLPAGEVGAIHVGSGSNFAGYTGGGGKSVVRGLMATGDAGYLDGGGRLFVTGRTDDMIVSGGENVYPAEVEDVLLAEDGIVDVAVVGAPDDEFGERLVAHVVCAPSADVDAADLKAAVASRLSRFKVPREIVFVEELPRTATGKVLRRQLGR